MDGLAIPALFIRHKDMHRSLKPWADFCSTFLPVIFPSELALVALLVSSDHKAALLVSLWPQGQGCELKTDGIEDQGGRTCWKWTFVSCTTPPHLAIAVPAPTYIDDGIPVVTHCLAFLFVISVGPWSVDKSLDLFLPVPKLLKQFPPFFFPPQMCR